MGYLFREYCYAELDQAVSAAWSQDSGAERYLITAAAPLSGGQVQFERHLGGNPLELVRYDVMTFPACTAPGPFRTDTGMTLADALQVSWAIALVWISVYGIKLMRRGL